MIQLAFSREPRPGDTIRGDVRIPEGPPPRSAVVVAHGFKGFKDWAFFPHLCGRLAAAGHAVVSFNFSRNGIGEHPEEFTELERFAANTLSLEQDELLLILREVLDGDLLPRRPRSVGLLGHSRGGGQAVLAAATEDRVDALVTWAGVSYFDRWSEETLDVWRAEGRVWVLNQRTGQQMPLDVALLDDLEENRDRLDILSAAGRIRAPWLVVHGHDDLTVPDRDARALARSGVSTRLVLIEEAGHTFEARHPFRTEPAPLRRAIDLTVAHFSMHLPT